MASIEDIKRLVQEQLDLIDDELVHRAMEAILVEPFTQKRSLAGKSFLCWGIVGDDMEMGMDSAWFKSLERAFYIPSLPFL